MPFDVSRIVAHGWQQGSLFTIESSRELLAADYRGDDSRLILASQDCDIVHRGNGEPSIDVFCATPVARLATTEIKARNSRCLHLPLLIGGETHPHSIRFWSRRSFAREILREHEPDANAALTSAVKRWFSQWLASRYDRAALPDAFNARLAERNARREIRAILEPVEHCYRDIFLSVDPPDEELQDGVPYSVRIILVVSEIEAGREEIATLGERGRAELERFMQTCRDLDIESVEIMTDTDLRFSDLDIFRAWDYTDLTLEGE